MIKSLPKIEISESNIDDNSYNNSINDIDERVIETGLDFILSHLEEPLYPRKISTKKSQNKQFQFNVENKQDTINSFKDSNFVDCRINGFPILKDGATWIPNLLFIDLDLADFDSNKRSLQLALNQTLKNIKKKLDTAHPTILWSGNGYHVILPVYCPRELERIQEFQEFNNPSERYLRFAKDFLSNNKADEKNYPSFKSCLLRIPNSLNSKCLAKGYNLENSKVKIIQEWDGYRPPIKEILYDFRRYLIQKKITDYNYKQKLLIGNKERNKNHNKNYYPNKNHNNYYDWIETILQTPCEDCRKIIISLILAPYLINVKKLPFQQCYQIIKEWLDKCNSLEKLDHVGSFNYRISYSLKNAEYKQIGPMSQYKIKIDNNYRKLFLLLRKNGIMDKINT